MTVPIPDWLAEMEADAPDSAEARAARTKYLLQAASVLLERRGNLTTLAPRLGCSVALLMKLTQPCRDARMAPELAIKVERVTAGAVTRAMLRPDLYL